MSPVVSVTVRATPGAGRYPGGLVWWGRVLHEDPADDKFALRTSQSACIADLEAHLAEIGQLDWRQRASA